MTEKTGAWAGTNKPYRWGGLVVDQWPRGLADSRLWHWQCIAHRMTRTQAERLMEARRKLDLPSVIVKNRPEKFSVFQAVLLGSAHVAIVKQAYQLAESDANRKLLAEDLAHARRAAKCRGITI